LNVIHRLLPWLAILAIVAGPRSAGAETWREQSSRAFEARGLTTVRIENARGTVTVRRGSGDQVRLTALKTIRAGDHEERDRYSKGTTVVTDKDGGRLLVKVRYPQRQSVKISFWEVVNGYEMPRVDVRLTVEIPDGLSVQLLSTSGDLVSEDLQGSQSLETTSGDVSIRGAGARVRVHTTSGDIAARELASATLETVSGDIEAAAATGPLALSTTSGDLAVEGARDSLRLTSVSGDIRVEGAPRGMTARSTSGGITVEEARGSVRLESSSGDIRVALASPLMRADISTVSGDVVAAMAAGMGINLEMRTTNGTLDVDVPLEVRTVSRRVVSGVIGNGKAPVTFRSSSGDIHLSSGELP
jgi:hypothetical protein